MSLASTAQQQKRPPQASAPRPASAPAKSPAAQALKQPLQARPQPTPQAPKPAPVDPALQALLNTIAGLETVIDEETEALKTRGPVDLETFSNRKSQGLMELNRSLKQLEAMQNQKVVATRLDSLRNKLAANQAALQLHLEAVREISGIIASAIRESESDGTYSHTIRRSEAAYGYD